MFDVGFRGSVARARTPGPDQGAGLGLAIAAGIVRAHGGELEVTNQDAGCCFRLRLPATLAVRPSQADGAARG
jgi:signal transduction histidine kinase